MIAQLKKSILALILLFLQAQLFAQAPPLGSAAEFALFSTVGAVGNSGISQITGNVGTNNGSSTGFGNVNGVMHDNDVASAQCAADLLIAYNQLNSVVPTFFPSTLLGNGQILNPGVYSISSPATLNLELILDAQGDPAAVFIFKIQGSFSANANSTVSLINGALACNVFWKVEGMVSMASGTSMKGTVIANNAAIDISTGATLEGRALTTAGAVTVSGVLAYTPIGCGSPVLTGPIAPVLASAACYALLSTIGPVSNTGITYLTGDVGTNDGLTTGYNPLFVTGAIHPIPDGSTAQAASDLLNAYNYLNALPYDIELLYPAQFGNSLVLTPHTYVMNGAVTFTDTLFLNAQGDADAIFVIKIYGALSTSTYAKVALINGTQSKNVYWMVNGAVEINDNSEFVGTIIVNNGAINLNTGAVLDGRALTTTGAIGTSAVSVIIPTSCSPVTVTEPMDQTACSGTSVSLTVIASGIDLIYQWRKGNVNLSDGGNISGATTNVLTFDPVNISDAASDYNVIITGAYTPNDTSANVTLVVNTATANITTSTTPGGCGGDPVTLTATGGGTYLWNTGENTAVIMADISGTYSVTVTNNGCEATASQVVSIVPQGITLICPVSPGLTYALLCSANVILDPLQVISCGSYTAEYAIYNTNALGNNNTLVRSGTGLDASGDFQVGTNTVLFTATPDLGNISTCSTTVMVQDNTLPMLGTCPGDVQSCSSIVSFVAPSYTDNCVLVNLVSSHVSGSAFPSGLTVVTYTATDAAGNTATCAFNITVTPLASTLALSTYNGFGASCFGDNNGSATLTITSGVGPFTFVWSNNFTQTTSGASTASGLSAGPYTVTVSNGGTSGCTLVRNFIISQPQAIACSITGQNISCANLTGTATLTATGGVLPYSYAWSNGASTQNLSNIGTAGTYTVTITDANGCVCTNSITIQSSIGVLGSGSLIGNQYEGANGTTIPSFYNVNTIEISGGTQPYTYNWNTTGYVQYSIITHSNGSVTITIVYADNANWDLTIANCQGEQLYFDNQPDSPTSSTLLDIESYVITPDNGSLNGTISLNVEGGTTCANGTYNYVWEGQQNITNVFTNSPNQTGLKTGWYIVTVTDCSGQTSIGWYWVPKQVRGRGKLAEGETITAYPNPFAETTTIEFIMPQTSEATLDVYSLDGRKVAQLYSGIAESNVLYQVQFQSNGLPSGLYILSLNTPTGKPLKYSILLTN